MNAARLDQCLEVPTELVDPRHDRRRARIAEYADRLPRHVVGDAEQRIEILRAALARGDALENLGGPRRTFAALGALRTALVREEPRRARDELDQVLGVVDDRKSTRLNSSH